MPALAGMTMLMFAVWNRQSALLCLLAERNKGEPMLKARSVVLLAVCCCAACAGTSEKADPQDTVRVVALQTAQDDLLAKTKADAGKAIAPISTEALESFRTARQAATGVLDDLARTGTIDVLSMRQQLAGATAAVQQLSDTQRYLAVMPQQSLLQGLFARELAMVEAPLREATQRVSTLSNHYGLYVGGSFSLEADGSWIPGAEAMFRAENQVAQGVFLCPKKFFMWCRRFTEFTYQTIGAVDAVTGAAGEAAGDDPGGGIDLPIDPENPGAEAPGAAPADAGGNPFLSKSGYFRFNTGAKWHFYDWIGLGAGIGLSSIPDTSLSDTRLEPRVFGGISTMTMYHDGALSQMLLGVAYDEFWQREVCDGPLGECRPEENFGRLVVDALLMIPGVQPKGFNIVARIYGDRAIDGEGPDELRASLLLYQPFSDWQSLFNPLKLLRLQRVLNAPGALDTLELP